MISAVCSDGATGTLRDALGVGKLDSQMKHRRVVKVRLLMVTLVSVSSVIVLVLNAGKAKAEIRPQTPAELWLSSSSDAKADYVWSYLSGFLEGKRVACSSYADKIAPYKPH